MGTRFCTVLPRNMLSALASLRGSPKGSIRPPDDADSPRPRRRALLVGISYHDSTDPVWTPLEGPFFGVHHFLDLLIRVYIIHQSLFPP